MNFYFIIYLIRLIYFIEYLLREYKIGNPRIVKVLSELDVYICPSMNPDGNLDDYFFNYNLKDLRENQDIIKIIMI